MPNHELIHDAMNPGAIWPALKQEADQCSRGGVVTLNKC